MEAASFGTQANALLRKNITFQKRNIKTNLCILVFPILLCLLLVALQTVVDKALDRSGSQCGCICLKEAADGTCKDRQCGLKYSSPDRASFCAVSSPSEWPPLLQVPQIHSALCWQNGNCPVTVLLTGGNKSFATNVAEGFFGTLPNPTPPNISTILSTLTLGSSFGTERDNFIEPAFSAGMLYSIQPACLPHSTAQIQIEMDGAAPSIRLECINASSLWRNSSSEVNKELYNSYNRLISEQRGTDYLAAYDFLDTNNSNFNVRVWYDSINKNGGYWGSPPSQLRIVRSVNVITNAYLKYLKGPGTNMLFEFIKEMPKPATKLLLDFSSLLGPLFFKWVIELIFPVMLINLVYEKQHKLRIMMKMHGLGDGPYWIISYGYFLLISVVYVLFLVVFGSLIGLKFFSMQDYSLQFVFYFAFINLQIVFAFLASTVFTNVKSAQAVAYIYIFGSGLLAAFLFQPFVQDLSFPKSWIRVMELIPAFSLFRMLYEFGEYSFNGRYTGTTGMQWKDMKDDMNGMKEVLVIIVLEWFLLLLIAYYTDQPSSEGDRIHKNTLFFLSHFKKKFASSFRRPGLERQGSKVFVEVEKPDVIQERTLVEQLRREHKSGYAIISDDLKKIYRGQDGNPDKLAVEGMSLALPRGECFGMLGPNGAGKTTFINMMIGLIAPTSGNAYVEGYSITTDMNKIYTSMGVCPQKDMLWETLTGREHLLFYGRLKNLNGRALTQAVEESLQSVNLFHGGIGDKQVRKYSGGMKRRLSVAISLIGDPKVVYMDEPSTGLDPASRNNLWNVMKKAKQNRAIILTTHSMEEAEVLCDRLGIFVSGALQCIGNPKQLKARYGETYVFTMTTTPDQEQAVERLVLSLSSNAIKVYHIPGTLKFEIPKQDVKIADVFKAVEEVKRRLPVQAWGLANTTLEDVFIKVAKEASLQSELS